MINNDDISEELAKRINDCVIWHDGPQVDVAKVVELLLDAGLVSPPCWEVVGETIHNVTVFKRQDDARRWVEADRGFRKSEMRHWKGEVE